MKRMLIALGLVCAPIASANEPIYLNWKCQAQLEAPNQPCGGINARTLEFTLGLGDENRISGGLFHLQSYGGCYPVASKYLLKWTKAEVNGDIVTVEAQAQAYVLDDIPDFFESDNRPTVVLKINAKNLTVDVVKDHTLFNEEQPKHLTCAPRN